MSDGGRDPHVNFRLPPALLDYVDAKADSTRLSRSDVIRRSLHFMREAHDDTLEREREVRDEIDDIIAENQELRKIVPSKWRSHIQGLFVDDLRDDTSPNDLRIIASGYRRQAEKMEELAEMNPHAPEADLVSIVDEELHNALEAADLSNWYDAVDNPHERHLTGVSDGMGERKGLVAVVQGAVETYTRLAAAFDDPEQVPGVKPTDLPSHVDSLLPDDVTRDDVAHLATELVRAGVAPDEVPDVIPVIDPALDGEEIDSIVDGGQIEVEPATITKGGTPVDVDDQADAQPDAPSLPRTVPASETTQKELMQAIAAADGGRHPDSVPGYGSVEDSDMTTSPTTESTAESTDEQEIREAAQARLAELTQDVDGDADE